MDLSDDLPPQRRHLFFPVVIATVLLSIIGMSAGLILGAQRDRDRESGQQQQGQDPTVDYSTTTPAGPTKPAGPPCRSETQDMASQFGAVGTLRVALELRTKTSAVWICVDEGGRYYYHANRGGADGPWIERETALFLADVRRDGEEYLATASDGTTFSVTTERLFIVHKNGKPETQEAVR